MSASVQGQLSCQPESLSLPLQWHWQQWQCSDSESDSESESDRDCLWESRRISHIGLQVRLRHEFNHSAIMVRVRLGVAAGGANLSLSARAR